jgi:hypothetical protein
MLTKMHETVLFKFHPRADFRTEVIFAHRTQIHTTMPPQVREALSSDLLVRRGGNEKTRAGKQS